VTNEEATGSRLVTASGSFSTRVTTNETNISSLQTASGSASTRLTNLESASGSFSTRTTNLESTASVLTNASASFVNMSSSLSIRVTNTEASVTLLNAKTGSYATTGSNTFTGTQTVQGTIIAQTLNVQQVTSSIVYSSGSNIFGKLPGTDVQSMTGSLRVTGSGDHWVMGGNVGLGTTSPSFKLDVSGSVQNQDTNPLYITNASSTTYFGGLSIRQAGTEKSRFASNSTSGTYIYDKGAVGTSFINSTDATTVFIKDDGNVGIGTTNPANGILNLYKSSGTINISLQSGVNYAYLINTGSYIALGSNSGTTGVKFLIDRTAPDNAFIINSNGSVGIGTTTPSTSILLDINGSVNVQGTRFAFNTTDNSSFIVDSGLQERLGFVKKNGFGPKVAHNKDFSFIIAQGNSSSLTPSATYTDQFTIDTSNNVYFNQYTSNGFLKTSGGTGLIVVDTTTYLSSSQVSGTSNYVARFTNNNTVGTGLIYDNNTAVAINTTTTSWTSGGTIYAPVLSIDAGTSNIAYFKGTSVGSAGVTIYSHGYFLSLDSGSVRVADFKLSSDSLNITTANHFLINPTGNVGIGTTSATWKLQVETSNTTVGMFRSSGANTILGIDNSAADGDPQLKFYINDVGTFTLGVDDSDDDKFKIGTTDITTNTRLTINSSGNVGIGTTVPNEKLHIQSGIIYIDGENGGLIIDTTDKRVGFMKYNGREAGIWRSGSQDFEIGRVTTGTLQSPTGYSVDLYVANDGNIGIGTTSPGAKLHIVGTESRFGGAASGFISVYNATDRSGYIQANGGTDLRIASDTDPMTLYVNGSERMRITANGDYNYGPGNPQHSSNSVYRQAFWGAMSILWRNAEDAYINSNHTYSSTNTNVASYTSANGIGRLGLGGGFFEWLTYNGSVTAGTAYALSTKFIITSAGNVGIGTTSPGYLLDIAGSSRSDLHIFRSNQSAPTADAFIFRPADNTVALGTANTERLRINSGGNVGIGTTAPTSILHVRSSDGTVRFASTTGNDAGRIILMEGALDAWSIDGGLANGTFLIRDEYNSSTRLAINNSGNVGIGTTSPGSKLTINGDNNTIYAYTTAADGQPGLVVANGATLGASTNINYFKTYNSFATTLFGQNVLNWLFIGTEGADNNGILLGTTNAKPVILGTSNNERLRITSDGNVGIGTTSVTNKLTVIGSQTGTQITTVPIGKFINTGNSFSKFIVGSDNSNYDAVISMDNNATLANTKLRFYIGNGTNSTAGHSNDQIVLQGDGNVGIATSTPKAKLQVKGSISSEKKYDGREDGLVLYYPFSENTGTTTADRSQTGMIGTLTNGPSWSDGIFGYSLALDGSNDYVSVAAPDSSVSFGTAMTYAMWVYPTSTVAQRYYLFDPRGDGSSSGMSSYFLFDRSDSTSGTFTVGNTGYEVISSNVAMGTNQWYHVSATRSGSTWKIYLNGVLIKTGTSDTTSLTLSNSFRIGTYSGAGAGPQYYFAGNIDEARMYNRTLSANEVMTLYLEGVGTTAPYTNANGNVGIGTTSPVNALTIYNATNPGVRLQNSTTGTTSSDGADIFLDGSDFYVRNIENSFIALATNNTERMRITSGGNVGIGTTAPSYLLHVAGTSYFTSTMGINGEGNGLTIDTGYGNNGRVGLMKYGGLEGMLVAGNSTLLRLGHRTDSDNVATGGSPSIRVDILIATDGNVTIGSSSPSYKLDVSGTIRATGDVIAYSDARVKDNIITVENALDKVKSLRGVTYTRKDDDTKTPKVGVIAQEVLPILPEVVQQDTNGNYSVAYGNMVGVLIEAIKEQQRQIDELKYLLQNK
jgi:hypothetical protein